MQALYSIQSYTLNCLEVFFVFFADYSWSVYVFYLSFRTRLWVISIRSTLIVITNFSFTWNWTINTNLKSIPCQDIPFIILRRKKSSYQNVLLSRSVLFFSKEIYKIDDILNSDFVYEFVCDVLLVYKNQDCII